MKVDVFSIFPEMVTGYTNQSILGRSIESGILEVSVHDLRLATSDKHRTIDDPPFGGGAGMVLMPEPVFKAVEEVNPQRPLILLGPSGRKFDQRLANELSDLEGFSLLCGRYEGVDERIRTDLCDDEISIGDFVLAGVNTGRFLVNTTVGVLGIFDVAHALGISEYEREDYGQSLAKAGMGPGCYVVLPVLGPSTARDAVASVTNFMGGDAWYNVTVKNDN